MHKSKAQHRFWQWVDKNGPMHQTLGRCWIWMGSIRGTNSPYGQFMVSSVRMGAHRYSWTIHHGKIPDGLNVLHKCDNPICVNPAHLFIGTHGDNVRDKVLKNRQCYGERNGRSILTESQVREIRRRYKYGTARTLAAEFNVSKSAIHMIVKGRNWKHIS